MQDLRFGALLLLVLLAWQGPQSRPVQAIRLNQVGFYPGAPKAAFAVGAAGDTFYVVTADLQDTVFTGLLGPRRATALSSDTTRAADFSALRTPGEYVVLVPGLGASYRFAIRPRVLDELARGALKAFYSQRGAPDPRPGARRDLRLRLTMHAPPDGGVYHKLTEPRFEGFVGPAEARSPRYVVQKSTAAALDFAAVMAQASRVVGSFESRLPGLADSALTAAVHAWSWARHHADVFYDQERLNQQFEPHIETGTYGDRDVRDEFIWAATELGVTTRQDSFFTAVPLFPDSSAPLPSWQQVRTLGYYTLARFRAELTPAVAGERVRLERSLIRAADELVARASQTAYGTVMGGRGADFVWGSNSVAANQGIALVVAYRLTGDRSYLRNALGNLDYLLGRNATGFSFVTGFGGRTPLHPHHRPSAADGIDAPVPGLLVGGPNPGRQDGCVYPVTAPDKAYVDDVCAYASNEVAINWNAPLVYLGAALEALQYEAGFSQAAQ